MLKKTFRIILISLFVVIVLLSIFYVGIAIYFKDGFSYGTYINGIYACGRDISELNRELLFQSGKYEGLTIKTDEGKDYTIFADKVGYTSDYTDKLNRLMNSQNPLLWGYNLIYPDRYSNFLPDVTYDEDAFDFALRSMPFITGIKEENRTVSLRKTPDNGYELNNMRENVLDEEKAKELIKEYFTSCKADIDLKAEGLYRDLPLTDEMKETISLYEKIDEFQDRDITYIFGDDREYINRKNAADFMLKDEEGNYVFNDDGSIATDEEKLLAYVDYLGDKYDTYGKREFKTTEGRTVTVEGGNYGNKIDREAEKTYLLDAFSRNLKEEHEPAYEHEAPIKGLNDLGDTYIEIDITNQKMYYYENGELIVETDVVTGNLNGHATIRGTYSIYNHRQNTVLVGPDYRSYVNFWLGVYKGYGIHDASWRSEFGGEIYKNSGSHGCINTPYAYMKTMWERVEDGTPCVLFY